MPSTVTFAPAGNELIFTGPLCAWRHVPSRQTVSRIFSFCISTSPRVLPKEFVLHFLLAISGKTSQQKIQPTAENPLLPADNLVDSGGEQKPGRVESAAWLLRFILPVGL